MRLALSVTACLVTLSAHAAVSGRIKIDAATYNAGERTVEQALGYRTSSQRDGQLRVAGSREYSRWRVEGAVQVDVRNGSAVARDQAVMAVAPALAQQPPDTGYWKLHTTFVQGGRTQSTGRIDRLDLSWTGDQLVLRVGRQALTWGSGLVFHPMDLVNPFQPVATDTVYKRGTDMTYAQWLFNDGSDVQFAAVPRRRRAGADAESGRNTYAALANIAGETAQWTLLLARNRSDSVAGGGISHAIGSAVWNGEVVVDRPAGGAAKVTLLSNLSWATVWHGDNLTLFAEYYHNGFGEARSRYTAADLDAGLLARLQRGDLFVTGRDYLCLGATWGVTPLLQLMPTTIVNLRDHSALFDVQGSWSISDNTLLKAGVRLASGSHGTELAGLEIAPSTGIFLAGPGQAFVRLEHYFQTH